MSTLRFILRKETSVAHAQLDTALIEYDLSDCQGLTNYLSIHYLARQHLRSLLNGWEELRDDAARLLDLSADLAVLGAPLPSWTNPPDLTPRHPLGLIYVMAGSALGSNILYKNWALSAHPLVTRASRFVTHSKNNDIWKRFLKYVESNEFSEGETNRIVTSANFCFEVFEAASNEVKSQEL